MRFNQGTTAVPETCGIVDGTIVHQRPMALAHLDGTNNVCGECDGNKSFHDRGEFLFGGLTGLMYGCVVMEVLICSQARG